MIIDKTPNLLAFAGIPMRYSLKSESGKSPISLYSTIRISFTAKDTTAGHWMTVEMNATQRTFTLRTEPTEDNELPVALSGETVEQWCTRCFEYLQNDFLLLQDYVISRNKSDILLTARVASSIYDWEYINGTITGVSVTTEVSGQSPSKSVVEGVLMRVYLFDSLIGQEFKEVDSAGEVRFDISEYVYNKLLLSNPPRFNNSLAGYQLVYSDYIGRYKVVFVDKVNGEFQARTYADIDRYAIAGGLSREDLVYINSNNIDFFSLTTTKEHFLTWWSGTKFTDRIAKESLFFAFQTTEAYSYYKLLTKIYSSSGSSQIIELTTLTALVPYTVVEFAVGFAALGLSSYYNDTVYKWEVYLEDETSQKISDVFTFEIDPVYHENTRYFRFRNSWGVYDTIRCTGNFELNLEHEKETSVFLSEDIETAYNPPENLSFSKERQLFKANSGYVSKELRQFLRDFERSFDIYEHDGSNILSIIITSTKSNLSKDDEYNYFLSFEYKRSYTDFFFSRMLKMMIKKAYSGFYSSEYF